MLHLTLILEDTQMVLKRTNNSANIAAEDINLPRIADVWEGYICDGVSGLEQAVEFTDLELASIQALMIMGDDAPHAEDHYRTLGEVISKYNWDNEVGRAFSPIP